jgi:hypothetical protein
MTTEIANRWWRQTPGLGATSVEGPSGGVASGTRADGVMREIVRPFTSDRRNGKEPAPIGPSTPVTTG